VGLARNCGLSCVEAGMELWSTGVGEDWT
jgi:hypothetical protein